MQYNININQKAITENFPSLDLKDAVILDFMLKVKDNPNFDHKSFSGHSYVWLSYSKIIEELPLLKIKNKESLARRFKKLVKLNLISSIIDRTDNSKTYWKSGTEFYKLFFVADLQTQKSIPPDSKVEPPSTQKSTNNNTIDNNINKKKTKFDSFEYLKSLNHPLEELLLDWLEVRKAKKTATTKKAIDMAIKKLDSEPDEHKEKIIENSIIAGWTTLYPLKPSDIKQISNQKEKYYQSQSANTTKDYKIQKAITAETEEEFNEIVKARCEMTGASPDEYKWVRQTKTTNPFKNTSYKDLIKGLSDKMSV